MERASRYFVRVVLPVLATLVLIAGFSLLSSGTAMAAGAQTAVAAGSQATTHTTVSAAATCAGYDSWCAYCSRYPDADTCDAVVPGHMTNGKVTGAANHAHNHYIPGVNFGGSVPGVAAPVYTGDGS